jgi:L-iditol 2-dehydrogenase
LKAAVFYSRSDIRLNDLPVPKIGPGELLVKMHTVGLCGTDVTKIVNESVKPGTVLGHELTGTVEEVGQGVTEFGLGQRVVALHHVPCQACWYCQHGDYSMCHGFKTSNFDPGGFAEYVRIPAANVKYGTFAIPDHTSFDAATFTEPLACCLRVPQRSGWRAGDHVMVVGAGPVGLLLAQSAKLYLAHTWVTDMVNDRLALAREFGIDEALNPSADDVEARVRQTTGGVGLDGVILTASGQPVWDQAMRLVRDGGFIHLFAVKAGGAPTTVDINEVLVRQIQVMSTYSSTPIAARESLDLISRGLIKVEELISHRLSLADLGHAVDMAVRREGRKIMIESD